MDGMVDKMCVQGTQITNTNKGISKMTTATATRYESRIRTQDSEFYALVVRIDKDGQENVVSGFGGCYKTKTNAERAAAKFITKNTSR